MEIQENILDIDPLGAGIKEEPKLYSSAAVYGFSFFFSTIAGGILLVSNLNALKKQEGLAPVIAFSVMFPVMMGIVNWNVNLPNGLSIALNIGAAYLMKEYFWNKYIGKETAYTKRPFWIPLIVCLAITSVLLFIIFSSIGLI